MTQKDLDTVSCLLSHVLYENSITQKSLSLVYPIRAPLGMITDVQLAIFANVMGVTLFLLVVLFHYVAANNPKNKPE